MVTVCMDGGAGLDVIMEGYPASQPLDCALLGPSGALEPVQPAGRSGLSYDPASDEYTYVWKTDKAWAGTCGMLSLQVTDQTEARGAPSG